MKVLKSNNLFADFLLLLTFALPYAHGLRISGHHLNVLRSQVRIEELCVPFTQLH